MHQPKRDELLIRKNFNFFIIRDRTVVFRCHMGIHDLRILTGDEAIDCIIWPSNLGNFKFKFMVHHMYEYIIQIKEMNTI